MRNHLPAKLQMWSRPPDHEGRIYLSAMCGSCGLKGPPALYIKDADRLFWEMVKEEPKMKCDHRFARAMELYPGNVKVICGPCGKTGPSGGASVAFAYKLFWESVKLKEEGKTMNEDYERGVMDATKPFSSDPEEWGNIRLAERRKSLLAKKVTKWVIVMRRGFGLEESIFQGRLFDSKERADEHARSTIGDQTLGVFPLEIEVPA